MEITTQDLRVQQEFTDLMESAGINCSRFIFSRGGDPDAEPRFILDIWSGGNTCGQWSGTLHQARCLVQLWKK